MPFSVERTIINAVVRQRAKVSGIKKIIIVLEMTQSYNCMKKDAYYAD